MDQPRTVQMLRYTYNTWVMDPEIKRAELVKFIKRRFDCSYSTANRIVKLAETRRDVHFK